MTVTCCGCFIRVSHSAVYLPQVSVNTHATLSSSTSRTVLTQKFVNPRHDEALEEVSYSFPLYDGVSVVSFSCDIGGRTIKGVVKERELAKEDYEKAKESNKFAGLMQRSQAAGDVFMTSLGNVPPGAMVSVEITYVGELKHDAEVDGLRYTIPSIISPRYGNDESFSESANVSSNGMSLTVDAEMPSAIKSVQSPSHAVSVSIGTCSTDPGAEPSFKKASATLSLPSSRLDTDFVLQVVAAGLGEPSAVMETHPTIANQCALVTTLVPKFGLPPLRPEIVFLCDRSGSMENNISDLVTALRVFLKSLPFGVKFNICSFGGRYEFLWKESATYNEKSLDEALRHVGGFSANFGGTEIYDAMKQTFAQRFRDIELEVIMLTDGQIWNQEKLFGLIREEVDTSAGSVRVFTLGVGSGASSSLIEGAARAGNGASQTVSDGEKMDKKIVRMLKASLSPHISDYSLEIKYEKDDDDDGDDGDDGFELIEKVMAHVSIDTEPTSTKGHGSSRETDTKPTTSLYDPSYQDDISIPARPSAKRKYDHLPDVPPPSYLQAPFSFPTLYAFNRTTVYVLMSAVPEGRRAKSVLLRGTSKHGPLELEIEIQHLDQKSTTIHQLAAQKAVQDLENGGGWLAHAKTSSGTLLKTEKPSQFSEIMEREAVRLGVLYQVSGKWSSFVAVDENTGNDLSQPALDDTPLQPIVRSPRQGQSYNRRSFFSAKRARVAPGSQARGDMSPLPSASLLPSFSLGLDSRTAAGHTKTTVYSGFSGGPSDQFPGVNLAPAYAVDYAAHARFRKDPSATFGSSSTEPQVSESDLIDYSDEEEEDVREEERHVEEHMPVSYDYCMEHGIESDDDVAKGAAQSLEQKMHTLIALQSFDGSWKWGAELEQLLGLRKEQALAAEWPVASDQAATENVSATFCAISFLKRKLLAEQETWELVVAKAEGYLRTMTGETLETLDQSAQRAQDVKIWMDPRKGKKEKKRK